MVSVKKKAEEEPRQSELWFSGKQRRDNKSEKADTEREIKKKRCREEGILVENLEKGEESGERRKDAAAAGAPPCNMSNDSNGVGVLQPLWNLNGE